jgi:membrane protease YdiL (CAAX protease family)
MPSSPSGLCISTTGPAGVRWSGLAAIFGIGLVFGIVYARSGNVWIPAVMHGLWPPNMS